MNQTTHFLTGIASCAGCGASMLDTGQHYACPQETAQGPDHCATLPVDAGQLDRMVLQFLVNTLVTPDVLDLQTELLAEDSAQESSRLFFHSFIDAVLIGPESAVIRYSIGGNRISPTEVGPPAGSYVHEINLVHEHTVAEILVCPGDSRSAGTQRYAPAEPKGSWTWRGNPPTAGEYGCRCQT